MARGGKRDGAGRKAGSPNKASAKREAEVKASGVTPLEYMLSILQDVTAEREDRMWAAEKAAPYVHPKLANVMHKGDAEKPIVHEIRRTIVRPASRHPNG